MTSQRLNRGAPSVAVQSRPDTPPSTRDRRITGILAVFLAGPLLLLILSFIHITQGTAGLDIAAVVDALIAPDGSGTDNIVRYIRLPRVMIGIVAGAGLGVAGVLLQSVTRNPLASPATLGIMSGAYLALVASTIFAPGIFGFSPVLIAFSGGIIAALIAYSIAGGVQITPVRLALAGVAVSLTMAALTAFLQLLYENEIAGLFFWGAGSLMQNDWGNTQYAWPRIVIGGVGAIAIGRSLDVLSLGDDVARSLGQRVRMTRGMGLLLGVFLAAVAVSVVGPIGFVGLVVPHVVRLMGVTKHRLLLPGAAIWGALVLVGADVVARAVVSGMSELPAGGVTALIGAPFLIWLARRSAGSSESGSRSSNRVIRVMEHDRLSYRALITISMAALMLVITAGVVLGDVSISLPLAVDTLLGRGTDLSERVMFELRLPRLLVAACAGAALAVSGAILQGVVRNPLAGPSIIGVTGGAGLAALLVLVLLPSAPFVFVPLAAFAGAFIAAGLVYTASWKGGVEPTRLALVGVAVAAFCAAGTNLLVVRAQLRVAQALVWLSGSTYARGWEDLLRLAPFLLVLAPLAWIGARQLDLLGLGDNAARGLGLQVERARLALIGIAVALAAVAVATLGAISFVGLIGPHSARLMLGTTGHHRKLIPLAAIFGAIIVALADIVGRAVLAPNEIPAGLVTSLIGTPYFLWLLRRSRVE